MIARNDLLQYATPDHKVIRVLWIDAARVVSYVFDIESHAADAQLVRVALLEADLDAGRAQVLADDPYLVQVNQQLLPQKHVQLRARAWDIIRDLTAMEPAIYEPRRRGQLVSESTRRHGVSHPTIYRYLRRYWQRGQTPDALLPDYANSGARGKTRAVSEGVQRGRPRKAGAAPGVNADEAMRKVFRVAVARHAATHPKFARRLAYEEMILDFFSERRIDAETWRVQRQPPPVALPTFGQFNYWLDQDNALGAPEPSPPLAPEAQVPRPGRPGAAFRIEALLADIYLLSRADRAQVAGRPVLYVVSDVFSGMVTGLHVSMEATCWPHALMALANSAADKQRFCAQYGRSIAPQQWPSRHLPELLLADEQLAAGWNDAAPLHDFNVCCVLAEAVPDNGTTPDNWCAELEKRFELLPPGAADAPPRTLCRPLDAVLDVDQFTRIVIDSVLHYNHRRQSGGHSPLQLWDWGVAQRGAGSQAYPEHLVRCCLLPVSEALVTADGIHLHGTYYECLRAIEEGWFERARLRGQWRVPVAFDAANLDLIYLRDPQAPMQFHACHIAERSDAHRQLSAAEIVRLRAGDAQARLPVAAPARYASFERIVATLAG
ncbi:MAG: Mu transposase C-terminal domain-containing protein [Pseudomonadota bacterium]